MKKIIVLAILGIMMLTFLCYAMGQRRENINANTEVKEDKNPGTTTTSMNGNTSTKSGGSISSTSSGSESRNTSGGGK
jgi:predicted outer membrane repeat protein